SPVPGALAPAVGYTIEWGSGYRVHLQSNKSDFQAGVGQQLLAFKTRVQGLQTSFAAETFGVHDYGIYSALPTPDGFDPNTSAIFQRTAATNLDAALKAGAVQPVPTGMTFAGDIAR